MGFRISRDLTSGRETAPGVKKNFLNLLCGDVGKPFEKLGDSRAAFEILEERLNRDTRPLEKPGTADLSRDAFHCRAFLPIKHA